MSIILIKVMGIWFLGIFWLFSPLFGEMIPNLTSIFFKGVGSTTNPGMVLMGFQRKILGWKLSRLVIFVCFVFKMLFWGANFPWNCSTNLKCLLEMVAYLDGLIFVGRMFFLAEITMLTGIFLKTFQQTSEIPHPIYSYLVIVGLKARHLVFINLGFLSKILHQAFIGFHNVWTL